MIRDMHGKREANVDNPEMSKCRNVETGFEHLSVTFKKPGFDNLPDLIGRTEYGTSKSYAVDNPKYGIIINTINRHYIYF